MRMISLLMVCCWMAACSGPSRLSAVPATLTDQVTVLGIPHARFWADTDGPAMLQEAIRARSRESGPQSAASYLALSGGSDNGAFGAGVLTGWTERPSFKLVTGISTGALIAPFAFLGPAYDRDLRAVYTEISPKDVYETRNLLSAVFHDALASTDPLAHLIARYANQDMLDAIATEYRKGRLLLIGTTNLDVQRPVIWTSAPSPRAASQGQWTCSV
jgi:Patatin-like phospholipase